MDRLAGAKPSGTGVELDRMGAESLCDPQALGAGIHVIDRIASKGYGNARCIKSDTRGGTSHDQHRCVRALSQWFGHRAIAVGDVVPCARELDRINTCRHPYQHEVGMGNAQAVRQHASISAKGRAESECRRASAPVARRSMCVLEGNSHKSRS